MDELKEHKHKWYTFGCKDATYLAVKSDYASLSFSERILLTFHTLICSYCKRFVVQNKKIKLFFKTAHKKSDLHLSKNKKDTINQLIKEMTYPGGEPRGIV